MNTAYIFFMMTLIFLLALLLGRIAARWRLPKVTGYLIAGILAGPSFNNLLHGTPILTHAALEKLGFLSEIALALILLTVSHEFKTDRFRRWGRSIFKLSATEIFFTCVSVASLTWAVDFFITRALWPSGHGLVSSFSLALFFGIIAIETAPAVTLLVVREYEAEGPLTEILFLLIGLNNLVALTGFILVSFFLFNLNQPVSLLAQLGWPVVFGTGVGFLLSLWAQRIDRDREFQLLLLGGVVLLIGLCNHFQVNMMLATFIAGAVLTNASPKAEVMMAALRQIDYPIYVIFFVISGAGLHLDTLASVGLLGVAFIVARTFGKFAGSWAGSRWGGFKEVEQKYLGFTMLAQAGLAIGLSSRTAALWPEGGRIVETVVLGSLVFFELAGPLSVRHGLVQAGEVSLLSLLVKKAADSTFEGFHQVVNHFRDALGIPVHRRLKSVEEILVKHVMRQNVETILDTVPFNDFLRIVAFSRYDRFPVVNWEGRFIGVVDYCDIRDMLFDPSLAHLLIVRDILKDNPLVIHDEQKLSEVIVIFTQNPNLSYLPVVDARNAEKLVGILSHNSVLALFRDLNPKRPA